METPNKMGDDRDAANRTLKSLNEIKAGNVAGLDRSRVQFTYGGR